MNKAYVEVPADDIIQMCISHLNESIKGVQYNYDNCRYDDLARNVESLRERIGIMAIAVQAVLDWQDQFIDNGTVRGDPESDPPTLLMAARNMEGLYEAIQQICEEDPRP